MRWGVLFLVWFSFAAVAGNDRAIDQGDITATLKEDEAEARGRKEAAKAAVVYRDARLRRSQNLFAKSAVSLSEVELALAEKKAAEALVDTLAAEEKMQITRLKIIAHQALPKEQIDPKKLAELVKVRETTRCEKARHRRDISAAFLAFHVNEVKRMERMYQASAASREELEASVAKRGEFQSLVDTWTQFLSGCNP